MSSDVEDDEESEDDGVVDGGKVAAVVVVVVVGFGSDCGFADSSSCSFWVFSIKFR